MASPDPVRLAGVDAFTATPMAGNGAVVALLPCPASDRWMQALAAELALPTQLRELLAVVDGQVYDECAESDFPLAPFARLLPCALLSLQIGLHLHPLLGGHEQRIRCRWINSCCRHWGCSRNWRCSGNRRMHKRAGLSK